MSTTIAMTSMASAQTWTHDDAGISVPPSVDGTAVAGATIACAAGVFSMTLNGVPLAPGDAIAIVVDDALFVTKADDGGAITIPFDALDPLRSGNRLKVAFSVQSLKLETEFALRGSRKAVDALVANCPTEAAVDTTIAMAQPDNSAVVGAMLVETEGYSFDIGDSYRAGDNVKVRFQKPETKNTIWGGFAKPDAKARSMLGSSFAGLSSTDRLQNITVPSSEGAYEFRIVDFTDQKILLAKPITVTGPREASVSAPKSVKGSTRFDVAYEGPDGSFNQLVIKAPQDSGTIPKPGMWVSLIFDKGEMTAPASAGTYEIRYVLKGGDDRVVAKTTFEVTQEASPVALQPMEVAAGTEFEVALGEDAPRSGSNNIYIAKPDAAAKDRTGGNRTVPRNGNPKLKAPEEPGEWEIRYVVPDVENYVIIGRALLVVK